MFFFGGCIVLILFIFGDLRNMSSTHSKNFCEKNGPNAPYKTKFEKETKNWRPIKFFFGDEFSTWKIMVSTRIKDICEKGHNLPDFEKKNRHNYSLNI
jgi:hypothetical protein